MFWEDHLAVRERKEAPPKRGAPEAIWNDPNYLPNYTLAAMFKPDLMTMQEFLQLPAGTEFIYDVECYHNFFCVTFQDYATGRSIFFELSDWCQLDIAFMKMVWQYHTKTGFNNLGYDFVIMELALAGCNNRQLKEATNMIINGDEFGERIRPMDVLKHFKVKRTPGVDQIDLMEVAPLRARLKVYGGRLHTPHMQDLPFHPDTYLNVYQAVIVRYYNFKDIIHTKLLRSGLAPQLQLRVDLSNEHREDLRSRSDAQIAETVMRKELTRILGRKIKQPEHPPGYSFGYKDPGFLRFQTQLMNDVFTKVLSTRFYLGPMGNVAMPEALAELEVCIGEGVYRMGIGGLHSSEKKTSHVAGGGWRILDRDVTSYYPYLILNQNLYPLHIGPQFLVVYRGIVLSRIHAKDQAKLCKEAGDEKGEARWNGIAQSLKIVINGAYGKLGSPFSCLYAPELLIQTTITGQLSVLMLIEAMHMVGIQTISANTDGITMKVHDSQMEIYGKVLEWWEGITRFSTEETEYLALYSRDVNNYIAVKKPKPGKPITLKTKGAFANPWNNKDEIEPWLHINPTSQVCVLAIEKMLTQGIAIEKTIRECTDMTQFINVRTVNTGCAVVTRGSYQNRTPSEQVAFIEGAGAVMHAPNAWRFPDMEYAENGYHTTAEAYRLSITPKTVDYLGSAIRWYYAKGREDFEFVAAGTGNRVGKTAGAMPCMDMPDKVPDDLDHDWYIDETHKILKSIAYA